MMFSLGCIQALKCDSGRCPVGVATQESHLYKGLDVSDKSVRVANFHRNTVKATVELMEACGFNSLNEINVSSFFRRLSISETKSLEEIYGLKNKWVTGERSLIN
jgi:glutamate synthase domain-containing protein 2